MPSHNDVMGQGVAYDYSAFGEEFQYSSAIEFAVSPHFDGVARIGFPAGMLDVLLANTKYLNNSDRNKILVCFGGAISKRKEMVGPFFSGRGLSEKLEMPLISFSDPTLKLDKYIQIGWYTGYKGRLNVAAEIASLLNSVADRYNCEFLFVGGSAGGFGIMNTLRGVVRPSVAIIWNPQTAIWRYWPSHVNAYLKAAFSLSETPVDRDDARILLDRKGVHAEVRSKDIANHMVLYCQNRQDKHVDNHMKPFLSTGTFFRSGKDWYKAAGGRCLIWLGRWGRGHAPLPPNLTIALASIWKAGGGLAEMRSYLSEAMPPPVSPDSNSESI